MSGFHLPETSLQAFERSFNFRGFHGQKSRSAILASSVWCGSGTAKLRTNKINLD
jgi:hypothetical protein